MYEMSSAQDSFVSVYSDARSEYTKQLCLFMTPAYFKWFISLLEKARETTVNEPRKLLWQFQTYLNDIPEWNMEKLNTEIHTIQTNIGCDYLEDLLTAVFIAHTKVLTAIRLTSKNKRIQITVPKVEHFLFKVLCETAKLLWGSSYLFNENTTNIEKQKNYRQIELLIVEGIHQATRTLVPVKSILKDFVNQEENEDDDDDKVESGQDDTEKLTELKSKAVVPDVLPQTAAEVGEVGEVAKVKETVAEPVLETLPESTAPLVAEPVVSLPQVNSTENTSASLPETQQIINISENPKEVSFTNYVTVFSPNNPDNSEIIRDSNDTLSDDGSGSLSLDFLDDAPQKIDLNEVINLENNDEPMSLDDYEELTL